MVGTERLHFLDRFVAPREFVDQLPEDIGAAAVLHIEQVCAGRKFVLRDVCREILSAYAQQQSTMTERAELALVEGFQWAVTAGLFIPDIHDVGGGALASAQQSWAGVFAGQTRNDPPAKAAARLSAASCDPRCEPIDL